MMAVSRQLYYTLFLYQQQGCPMPTPLQDTTLVLKSESTPNEQGVEKFSGN